MRGEERLTPTAAGLWGPGTHTQSLCRDENTKRSAQIASPGKSKMLHHTELSLPEVGFRLESHGQGFLFRHDEYGRGTVSLRTQTQRSGSDHTS